MDLLALGIGVVVGAALGLLVAQAVGGRGRQELASAKARAVAAEQAKADAEQREDKARTDASAQVDILRTELAVIMAEAASKVRLELMDQAKREREQDSSVVINLVKPVHDHLERVESGLNKFNLERTRQGTEINERLDVAAGLMTTLQGETSRLTTALRGNSTRGKWGEMQLRRVVEMAGLSKHVSFSEQQATTDEAGRIIPDLLIRLPEDRTVVIDAKAPMPAIDHDGSEEAHRAAATRNARDLREHIKKLGAKDYAGRVDGALDKVIMFLPAESVLAGALEADPGILDEAYKNNVVIATPTTLLAVLTSIELVWKQKQLAESASQIAADGAKLYESLSVFAEHLAKAGNGLKAAVSAYNSAIGSLESRVLPAARSMKTHGVAGSDRGQPKTLTTSVRDIVVGELTVAVETQVDDEPSQLEAPEMH